MYYLTLVLDWLASILTVVILLALAGLVVPTVRKRLGFGLDLRKDMWLAILGIVSIVVTHTFAKAISESETRAKYVELGVGILSSIKTNPANERTGVCPELSIDERALRKWAVGNVRAYSDVPMDPLIEERLICGGLDLGGGPIPQAFIDKARAARKAAQEKAHATP